jgi:pimeloyl-ACP methyl ester carboxylesterase
MYLARNAVIAGYYADNDFTARIRGSATPRSGFVQHDEWALFRQLLRGDGDIDRYIADLSRPGALTASLNWYRANLAPRVPGPSPNLRPVEAPTLGIWSTNDHYLDGERMKMSGRFVKGAWRYEQIEGASHHIPLDAPDRLNHLLVEWLS